MFKSILLPVDGSPLSLEPMHAAISLAKLSSGKLVILSVAEPRLFHASDLDSLQNGEAVEAINVRQSKIHVEKVLQCAKAENVPCEAVVCLSPLVEDEIIDAAQRFQCDLIVMATRGKLGVIEAIFQGSVTLKVLQNSKVPVFVYPSVH